MNCSALMPGGIRKLSSGFAIGRTRNFNTLARSRAVATAADDPASVLSTTSWARSFPENHAHQSSAHSTPPLKVFCQVRYAMKRSNSGQRPTNWLTKVRIATSNVFTATEEDRSQPPVAIRRRALRRSARGASSSSSRSRPCATTTCSSMRARGAGAGGAARPRCRDPHPPGEASLRWAVSFQWMRRRRSRLWIAQAMLPLRPGQVERRTHDYKRHGTASLYAAFNIATGDVLGRITEQHRAKEFLDFLKQIDRAHAQSVELHLILDKSSAHKTPDVNRWLEAHPRFKLHFTPTSASWLNAVEIRRYIDAHNLATAKPFVWTKSAESILA